MGYLGEFRHNLRPLAAASIGSGTSLALIAYTTSVFAPHLVRAFGWSRAQFALVGLTMVTTLLLLPFIGRFTDRLGVRRVALVGTVLLPLCFVGYALQQGSFAFFLFLSASVLAVGAMTSTLVYTRLIAANFERAQGLALTVVNCTPAALAVIIVPLLNWGILAFGWRAAYLALGGFIFASGVVALMLIPPRQRTGGAGEARPTPAKPAREDFAIILKSRLFWLIFAAMFLCLLGTPLHASQLNIMLEDNGLDSQTAANIVAIYAFSTILGRVACGLALDRFPTPYVSAASMFLPAIGFFLLATDFDTVAVIAFAMFLVGIFVGAENDLLAYLVARYFTLRIYSSTLSMLFLCSFLAAAIGAGGISLTLKLTDSFSPFLYAVSGTVLVGSLLFLFMPKSRQFPKIG